MDIQVRNCNNIENADIHIAENKLNIKLAPNGTGKSTIASAIETSINSPQELSARLLPFKYREENQEGVNPEVMGVDGVGSIMCFNEEYVKQFNFQQDELMANSFDILIRNDEYKEIEREIEALVSETRSKFDDNDGLEKLITSLNELRNAFKVTKTGVISQASTGMKGLKGGNKIKHIPTGLESYKPFIQSDKNVSWVAWQSQGCEFHKLSDSCPFCTSDTTEKQELIEKVGKEYDKNAIKNLIAILQVVEKLGDYLSDEAKEKLQAITTLEGGLESSHTTFIINIRGQIDAFIEKLEKLRKLSSFQFNEDENVEDTLKSYVLDLQFFDTLNSEGMTRAISPINEALSQLILKAGILKGKISIQRKKMKKIIEKHQEKINQFLSYAGYKYKVEIAGVNEDSKLKLKHMDYSEHISGGDQHLSFGERNAFSIVLFMYECLSKQPDLIILDDPISSFDKNKKYAILEMLFRRESSECLKNKTVLMLTHDVEPIIDTVKSLSQKFGGLTKASYLRYKDGVVTELPIRKSDIKTFTEICNEISKSDKDEITKLIYLRRNFEIISPGCDGYQVLSNLFHKRNEATDHREERNADEDYPVMEQSKFENGCTEVTNFVDGFDYTKVLERVRSLDQIKTIYFGSDNGYEKLQLFRLLETGEINSVIQKFVNETYHVENEYICQLNPSDFDTIPEYVIRECDSIVDGL